MIVVVDAVVDAVAVAEVVVFVVVVFVVDDGGSRTGGVVPV